MRKSRILVVFGTRPEAIKLAPVVKVLEHNPLLEPLICVTGQHRRLLDQVLETFELRPDYDLQIMAPNQALSTMAARILDGLHNVLLETSPDFVLVHGDTSTCFAASLASFYASVPVGHVEAGLRTWNLQAPFPEEAHRAMVGRIAQLHFAPTQQAKRNLIQEGTDPALIHVTGNTVVDALHMARRMAENIGEETMCLSLGEHVTRKLAGSSSRLVLVTGHRRENIGSGLETAAEAVRDLALKHPDWCFAYILHPNPSARHPPIQALTGLDNVLLLEPLEYISFVWLMLRSDIILTDSGGLQEEASELGTPILVMREVTERPEAVEAGTARLIGTNSRSIIDGVDRAILGSQGRPSARRRKLYGDGKASERIVEAVCDFLNPTSAATRRVPKLASRIASSKRPRSAKRPLVAMSVPIGS